MYFINNVCIYLSIQNRLAFLRPRKIEIRGKSADEIVDHVRNRVCPEVCRMQDRVA